VSKSEKQSLLLPQKMDLSMVAKGVSSVCASSDVTFLITKDGTAYGCGLNGDGQVGLGFVSLVVVELHALPAVQHASWIGGGLHMSAALVNGKVHTWGRAEECGLGLAPGTAPVLKPRCLHLPGIRVLRCGAYHSLACSEAGDVFMWGCGLTHQLGNRPKDSNNPYDKDDEPTDEFLPYLLSSKQLESRFVLLADGGAQHSVEIAWTGNYKEHIAVKKRQVALRKVASVGALKRPAGAAFSTRKTNKVILKKSASGASKRLANVFKRPAAVILKRPAAAASKRPASKVASKAKNNAKAKAKTKATRTAKGLAKAKAK